MNSRLFSGIMLLLALGSCTKESKQPASKAEAYEAQWPNAVTYEIFIQSFYDSDGDSIGDFTGMTQKLNYLQNLGVKGVWLMPMMPSPSYHKYDVTDYRSTHPDYGTLEQFKDFINEAHQRDIKVVIDFVVNHTGADHPWFLESKKGPESEFRDYYVWRKREDILEEIEKKETSLDSDNITQWHAAEGNEELYYGFFWGGMPDLNYDNPAVRKEIFDAGKFWLSEVGVDGFRLDAAKHIFPDDRPEDNHNFWIEFRSEMEKVKPDVYLVGEVWSDAQTVAPYLKGLPAAFNFDFGYAIEQAIIEGKDNGLVGKYKDISEFYQSVTAEYIDATFLKNHDQNRIMNVLGEDQEKAMLAASLLFTMPGAPYMYYGEEIGMLGVKPDEYIREPFVWGMGGSDPGQAKWIEPKYSTDATVDPASKQIDNQESMHSHYKELIAMRNSSQELNEGGLSDWELSDPQLISFYRHSGTDTLKVVHNLSNENKVLPLSGDMVYENNAALNSNGARIGPYGTIVVD